MQGIPSIIDCEQTSSPVTSHRRKNKKRSLDLNSMSVEMENLEFSAATQSSQSQPQSQLQSQLSLDDSKWGGKRKARLSLSHVSTHGVRGGSSDPNTHCSTDSSSNNNSSSSSAHKRIRACTNDGFVSVKLPSGKSRAVEFPGKEIFT
jgi:hypothetical protein